MTTEQLSQVNTGVTTAIANSSISHYSSVETEPHSTEQPDHAMDTTSSAEEPENTEIEQTTAMGQEDVQTNTVVSNEEITTSMDQVYSVQSTDALTSRSTYEATSGETTKPHSTTESDIKSTQMPELSLTETNLGTSTITTAVTYNETAAT